MKLVGVLSCGDLTVRGKGTDSRLCGLRHHSKNLNMPFVRPQVWRHDFIVAAQLRATRNRFDEIPTLRFSGRKRRSELSHVLGRLQTNWSPSSPGLQERSKGSQDLRATLSSTLRTGSAVAQASAELSFEPRRGEGGRCRSRLQRRQVYIQSAARSPERTAHRRVRRFVLSCERARLRFGRAGAAGPSAASGVEDLRLHCDAAGSRGAECADGAQR
jgi:hypothetical protein